MNDTKSTIHVFSADPDFDFEVRCALGGASAGAGDIGEILAAVAHVRRGDHEAWFTAWFELAERTHATAEASAAAGHDVSAAEGFLRASVYYAVAVNAASALADADRLTSTFAKQRDSWNRFIAHADGSRRFGNVAAVAIPYEGRTLEGWFFRPAGAGAGAAAATGSASTTGTAPATGRAAATGQTPATLVAVNGSDGSLASVWATCVAPALARGYNALVFNGPGQQAELFERGVPFRFDWENVLTPVYDFVVSLDNVDPGRVAVYGISQGGYWVARALAFEHRFAAGVTDPGVVDVSTSWTHEIPGPLMKQLDAGDTAKFDKEMAFGMKFSASVARTWAFRARPYGTSGYAETVDEVRRYTVADVASHITTPLLILSPEGEQFWPGQSEQLAALTPSVSTLVSFSAAEGANEHCEPLAPALRAQRVFDWLDDRVSTERAQASESADAAAS